MIVSKRRVLTPLGRADRVRVHRIGRPQHRMPFVAHRAQQRRQQLAHVIRAHARVERQPARHAQRVQPLAERDDLVGRRRRAELHADRVVHAGEELDVRVVETARALADPEQVRGAVVPVAGQRVLARQPLLVVEQQTLVAT